MIIPSVTRATRAAVESHVLPSGRQESPLPGAPGCFVMQLSSPQEIEEFVQEWSDLADRSLDANVFYTPWFFQPAAKRLPSRGSWKILLVWRKEKTPGKPPVLVGFFPFVERHSLVLGRVWALWEHPYCYLTTPLVEDGSQREVLAGVFEYVSSQTPKVSALEFPLLTGDGRWQQAMTAVLRERLAVQYTQDRYLRAALIPSDNGENRSSGGLAGHHLRELRRLRRKLEGLGQLEYRSLDETRGSELWLDWFLQLETSGWKAEEGTAIQQREADVDFFRQIVYSGLQQNRVQMEGLFLDGNPIALRVNLFSPPVSFAFKIAYDETLRKYSPGLQLELSSMERFGQCGRLQWSDSCAAPGHPMIDRVWAGRRVIEHLLVSTGHVRGDLVLGFKPFLRAVYRVQKRVIQRLRQAEKSKSRPDVQPSATDLPA